MPLLVIITFLLHIVNVIDGKFSFYNIHFYLLHVLNKLILSCDDQENIRIVTCSKFYLGERQSISDLSLLIVGGEDINGGLQDSTELICPRNKDQYTHSSFYRKHNFSVPNIPVPSSVLIGNVRSGLPLICGGKAYYGQYLSTCFELSEQGRLL